MTHRVAIVGAGLSGLAAARSLRAAGHGVTVFDKGRRPGGRANTRAHGDRRFDHGAQYFTVRDDTVRSWVAEWLDAGIVAEWSADFVYIDTKGTQPAQPATRYVGVPGMVDVALHLADGLDVRSGVRIVQVHREAGRWSLADGDGGSWDGFHRVVIAVPAPQAIPLLTAAPTLADRAGSVSMEPCWAAMLTFPEPLELGFDAAFVRTGQLSWVARDASKPGRPPEEAWVVHFNADWSRHHRETSREGVAELAGDALRHRFPAIPTPDFARAHRWGHALAPKAGEDILYDDALGIGACGDWCAEGRIEGAFKSGLQIARRVNGGDLRDNRPPGNPGPPR